MSDRPPVDIGVRTVGDYARAVWSHKWLIAGVAVFCALAAYYYSWRQAPQYKASTVLTFQQPVDPTNPLASSYVDPNVAQIALENVANFAGSSAATSRVATILGTAPAHAYAISTSLSQGTTSTGYSSAAIISAAGANARESATVANAYAAAVTEWSADQQLARVEQAEAATVNSLKTFKTAASRRSAEYIVLAQRLANLRTLAPAVTGQYQVLVPATAPSAPFAPRPKRSAMVGFGGGLFAAVALVLLFEAFSTRVRGRQEVGEVLGLPIVGVIPEISIGDLKNGKLVTMGRPESAAAEALRLLRSNLDYVNVDDVSSLLVTSCLAGEGKSTLVCNLAATLAMAGKRVVVVDGDLRKPRVHDYFGLSNEAGLTDVIAGQAKLADVLRPIDLPSPNRGSLGGDGSRPDGSPTSSRSNRLVVLTSGPLPLDPGELVASGRFGAVVKDLQNSNVDFVFVDSPALLEVGDAAAMAAQVEGLVFVVNVEKVDRPTLQEARQLLAPLPCDKLGAVLVRGKGRRGGYGYYHRGD